jgi:hypothetical protein
MGGSYGEKIALGVANATLSGIFRVRPCVSWAGTGPVATPQPLPSLEKFSFPSTPSYFSFNLSYLHNAEISSCASGSAFVLRTHAHSEARSKCKSWIVSAHRENIRVQQRVTRRQGAAGMPPNLGDGGEMATLAGA